MNARCPACDHELTDIDDGEEIIVWCDHGPCPSDKASYGIRGNDTVANLSKKLIDLLEAIPDWEDL